LYVETREEGSKSRIDLAVTSTEHTKRQCQIIQSLLTDMALRDGETLHRSVQCCQIGHPNWQWCQIWVLTTNVQPAVAPRLTFTGEQQQWLLRAPVEGPRGHIARLQ
jgi:hypothetical protein